MKPFKKYELSNAPEESVEDLRHARDSFGYLPNLLGYMAESPTVLHTYITLNKQIEFFSLSVTERQIVMMTVNRFHECRYCMAGHSLRAMEEGVEPQIIDAIRDDKNISDARYASLRAFTHKMVEQRGVVSRTLLDAFFKAGFQHKHVFEVIYIISLKIMSNYTNHVVGTEIDGVAMSSRWSPVNTR